MKNQLLEELASSNSLYTLCRPPKRNLGCAILAAAIDDYRSMDDIAHASAQKFLFPASTDYRKHFDWATAIADGVNPKWLRQALDQARPRWDLERGLALRTKRQAAFRDSAAAAEDLFPQREAAHG